MDLDAWTDEQLQSVLRWGNSRANKLVLDHGSLRLASNKKQILGGKVGAWACSFGGVSEVENAQDKVRLTCLQKNREFYSYKI